MSEETVKVAISKTNIEEVLTTKDVTRIEVRGETIFSINKESKWKVERLFIDEWGSVPYEKIIIVMSKQYGNTLEID